MTPRKYEILVRKFYESPNNVTFSEIKKILEIHGYWEYKLDGHDHYFVNEVDEKDIIKVAIKSHTKDRVKEVYVKMVRNHLKLKEGFEYMKKKLEKLNRYEEEDS